jgi:hypothetical protein
MQSISTCRVGAIWTIWLFFFQQLLSQQVISKIPSPFPTNANGIH